MFEKVIVVELPEDAGKGDFAKARHMLKEMMAKKGLPGYTFILKTHTLKFKTTDDFLRELGELLVKLKKRGEENG